MDDLISRKALLYTIRNDAMPITLARVFTHIHASPAIDPVHAAGACYCRECKHWQEPYDYCKEFAAERNQGDFCSRGQRREEDCGDRVDKN